MKLISSPNSSKKLSPHLELQAEQCPEHLLNSSPPFQSSSIVLLHSGHLISVSDYTSATNVVLQYGQIIANSKPSS